MVRQHTCPVCENAVAATSAGESEFFPFCSERCRNVDLLRWSDGRYAIVEPLDPAKLAEQLMNDLDDPDQLEPE